MSVLTLVRHGQADYASGSLTALGVQQCERLRSHARFAEIWSGTLIRQVESARFTAGEPRQDERWNEYTVPFPGSQRAFEEIMRQWVRGEYPHPEPWSAFRDRVRDALTEILLAPGSGREVAVFTSGGPIGVAVMSVLGAPDEKAIELNWRLRNTSLTRFLFGGGRISLDQFNTTPHLAPALESFR